MEIEQTQQAKEENKTASLRDLRPSHTCGSEEWDRSPPPLARGGGVSVATELRAVWGTRGDHRPR